jgi:hypothetical protein
MQVDREERFDFARLRSYRLGRARAALEASDLGALLVFDMNNVRYLTSTHIGEWARDKLITFALLKPGVCVNEIVALATRPCTSSAPTTSRRSTPSPGSAAAPIRTTSPTA